MITLDIDTLIGDPTVSPPSMCPWSSDDEVAHELNWLSHADMAYRRRYEESSLSIFTDIIVACELAVRVALKHPSAAIGHVVGVLRGHSAAATDGKLVQN